MVAEFECAGVYHSLMGLTRQRDRKFRRALAVLRRFPNRSAILCLVDFASYARQPDRELDLVTGALLIAQDAFPALDLSRERRRIRELSEPLVGIGLESQSASVQARALSDHLHIACGFRGNTDKYHDPDNSFLNLVIERRVGIPISLAVVYLSVAERVGIHARGIGFPGHFLVRVDTARETIVIDPFFGGEMLDRDRLVHLLRRVAPRAAFAVEMLDPASTRQMIARMLINLRALYAARGDAGRLLVVLDRLVDLMPEAYEEIRDRGFLCAKLGARAAAVSDLRRYLEALPHADDAEMVRQALANLDTAVALPD